jgi:hypothetical protein
MYETAPFVVEITLRKRYRFMYENFVIATQGCIYLLIEKSDELVDVLKFDGSTFKYGSPNDEARGAHPLMSHGLGFYGLFEVKHSPWIIELTRANRIHPSHDDSHYKDLKHYIACFKDVMLEVVCRQMQEVQLPVPDIHALVSKELDFLG